MFLIMVKIPEPDSNSDANQTVTGSGMVDEGSNQRVDK